MKSSGQLLILFTIFTLMGMTGCEKVGGNRSAYVPLTERYDKQTLVAKGDGEGLYDGILYGLEDRNDFALSRKLLEKKDVEIKSGNEEKIISLLSEYGLYQVFYKTFLTEKQFTDYMETRNKQTTTQLFQQNLGKHFVTAYLAAFKEGYMQAYSASDEEADRYKIMLEKSQENKE